MLARYQEAAAIEREMVKRQLYQAIWFEEKVMEQYEIRWRDYYQVLQVHKNAQAEIIKAAYSKLCQIYHPDKNPSEEASQKMAEINEAYGCLSDSPKKAAYDAYYAEYMQIDIPTGAKPKPHIDPVFHDLGEVALGKTYCVRFKAENLGEPEREQNEIDYFPKVSWVKIKTDAIYLPFNIIVDLDTSGLDTSKTYEGQVTLTLDAVTAKADFAFRTLDLISSLGSALGSNWKWY